MGEPVCKIYKETGVMPIDCLFGCSRGCNFMNPPHKTSREKHQTHCQLCGSDDVHWRQDNEGWRMYDNEKQHPGNRYILHLCPTSAEGFEDV